MIKNRKQTDGLVSKAIDAINECIDNNMEEWNLIEPGGAPIVVQKQMIGRFMSYVMQATHGHMSPKLAKQLIRAEISICSPVFGV